MLRATECPVSALTTTFKAGLGPFCRFSYELEVSEERSSDDQYDSHAQSAKHPSAGSRTLGVSATGCKGLTRNSSASCAPWVPAFLGATYFQPCERHRHHKKNECTFFCITCGNKPHSVCQHCMGSHAGHQVIQVRRYVYCDVVRTCDINAFVDTTGVQNYIINSAKVMFLNHRPHTKIGRANGVDVCRTCQRHLREGYSYCSLACKVEALTRGESSAAAERPAGPAQTAPLSSASPASASALPPAAPSPSHRLNGLLNAVGAASVPRFFISNTTTAAAGGPGPAALGTPRSGSGVPRTALVPAATPSYEDPAAMATSSDLESSEPGEDTVMEYGGGGGGVGAVRRRSAFSQMALREASGSASSEDDCCDFNFENPPKRRRSSLISRRASHDSSLDLPALSPGAPSPGAATDAAAAAAATAAATLLMPFRSSSSGLSNPSGLGGLTGRSSLGLSLARSLSLGVMASNGSGLLPESPAADSAGPGLGLGACGLRSSGSLSLSGLSGLSGLNMSRRKQVAPQRAPSC